MIRDEYKVPRQPQRDALMNLNIITASIWGNLSLIASTQIQPQLSYEPISINLDIVCEPVN